MATGAAATGMGTVHQAYIIPLLSAVTMRLGFAHRCGGVRGVGSERSLMKITNMNMKNECTKTILREGQLVHGTEVAYIRVSFHFTEEHLDEMVVSAGVLLSIFSGGFP